VYGLMLVETKIINRISLGHHNWNTGDSDRHNYVLDGTLNAFLSGTIAPPTSSTGEFVLTYRIYGNDRLLYTSPQISHGTPSVPFEVDISGIVHLRIEIDGTRNSFVVGSTTNHTGGIDNLTITIAN